MCTQDAGEINPTLIVKPGGDCGYFANRNDEEVLDIKKLKAAVIEI